jgi:DnaK suppressor protein
LCASTNDYDTTGDIVDRAQWLTEMYNEDAQRAFWVQKAIQLAHAQERDKKGLGETCEDCGAAIPQDRLKALPETTRCVKCQSIFEKHRNGSNCRHLGSRM